MGRFIGILTQPYDFILKLVGATTFTRSFDYRMNSFCYILSFDSGKPDMKARILGWEKSTREEYGFAYSLFGGSVCTHPDVVDLLSKRLTPPDFYVYKRKGDVIAAAFALNKELSLKLNNYPIFFDDIIIPFKKGSGKILMPFKTKQLSHHHKGDFSNCIHWQKLKRKTCVVKDDFSNKTHKKRRAEYEYFIKNGGECLSIDEFSDKALSEIYISLFKKRWGKELECYSEGILLDVFSELRHLVFGHVLLINGVPCAYDLVFKAECKEWIFFDCHNGGVDQAFSHYSVGSLLMYKNIELAKKIGKEKNIKVIYSLGMEDPRWEYKKQWCNVLTLGRSLIL
ncbi:transcriptional regulator [Serratia liquefaciens]|uniref:transcriptional regulator n=1 Tax=Serratia liquefaciens TaxID=614 RepID=UPI0018D967F2|nr:transcriptional regulator [Serratia liquefaciens]MBH2812659.1 transcriptional regulator [Serratia liquefaciens]